MIHSLKTLAIVAVLGLGACTSPDRFNDGNTVNLNGGPGSIVPGSPNDPASPAYFSQTIGDRVLFAVDQHTLTPEARAILDGQIEWLITNRAYQVTIEGHADEQGTREYNLALGARRASSVQQYMIAQGIDPARIRTVTYGKERPLEICSEEACYAKNRRAVTVLTGGIS